MSNFSQPTISSIDLPPTKSIEDILHDCMTIASSTSSDTITIAPVDMSYNYTTAGNLSGNTITISGAGAQPTYYTGSSGISTITLNGIDASSYSFNLPEEWVEAFPDWHRVEDMCKKYPGLEIAFRNFQTVYKLVKDDYDNPVPKK